MRSLQSELIEKGLSDARTGEVEWKTTRTRDKPKERLSRWEIEELMGVRSTVYQKVRGRVKQR